MQERYDAAIAWKSASAVIPGEDNHWGRELIGDLRGRTATLVVNAELVTILRLDTGAYRVRSQGEGMGVAAAVPISEDGYFVTASHAIDAQNSLSLIAWVEETGLREPRVAPARIVWKPDRTNRPDIAVLHANLAPIVAFTMADIPSVDDAVAASGASEWVKIAMEQESDAGWDNYSSISVGRVLGVRRPFVQRLPSYHLVRHSAPTMVGDSGGAVVDEGGRLIGINATSHPPRWLAWLPLTYAQSMNLTGGAGWYSRAVRPDFDWLMELIETDRQRDVVTN